ncbi:hypothetical protein [Xanthomonas translucens]|uniref:hypothetical protein n=1 Tax=Xanthomonas campestris pv. translucens TaxID=343 RepID=UPI000B08B79C|nr:hypothetical protein [Xanthomonas translucens]
MKTEIAPEALGGLLREYRPTMAVDVLHSWAAEAVTALNELIEADKEYDAARAEFDRCALYRQEWRRICLRLDNAVARRRTALARVCGAP